MMKYKRQKSDKSTFSARETASHEKQAGWLKGVKDRPKLAVNEVYRKI